MNILKAKQDVTKSALLFVGAILKHLGQDYDWTDKWTREVMLETVIKLPATPAGEPDWGYMDAYMRRILDEERGHAVELLHA